MEKEKESWLDKLQKRWQLKSTFQVIIVLIVFSCTGMTAVYIKKPIFAWLGISAQTPLFLRIILYILTVLPAYQVLLLFYGFIFGQFNFFWEFEKKMWRRLAKRFNRS